eukprot:2110166-Prymnesium_polylepis.1
MNGFSRYFAVHVYTVLPAALLYDTYAPSAAHHDPGPEPRAYAAGLHDSSGKRRSAVTTRSGSSGRSAHGSREIVTRYTRISPLPHSVASGRQKGPRSSSRR